MSQNDDLNLRIQYKKHSKGILFLLLLAVFLGQATLTLAADNTLQKIRAKGTINIGYRVEAAPFSYLLQTNSSTPVGYTIDICQRIMQNLQRSLKMSNLKLIYIPVDVKNRYDALKKGQIDMECANTANTRERREKIGVAFSVPYYITGARVLVRSDLKISNLNELARHTVAIVKNTAATAMIHQQNQARGLNLTFMDVENRAQAFELLENRKADAFVQDDIVLYNLRLAASNPATYDIIGGFLSIEPLAIMVRNNDQEFKQVINKQMVSIIHEGELRKLYKKWFESPIPPRKTNFNMPMNSLMRDMMRNPTDKVSAFPD